MKIVFWLITILFITGACANSELKNPQIGIAEDPWLRPLDFSLTWDEDPVTVWRPISNYDGDSLYSDWDSKPYVILVSIDGYRYDYTEKYKASTLASFDVKAEKMIPSFPSKTFPNHFTIVTGSYPGKHGLISNTFYDPESSRTYEISNKKEVHDGSWYKKKPVWWYAEEKGIRTASMFWVGSEAINPNYHYPYNSGIPNEARVNKVLEWLDMDTINRPHFISLYFEMIDDLGHDYGPDSEEVSLGVKKVDSLISYLKNEIEKTKLPVNIIVVSDHGMLELDQDKMIDLRIYEHKNAKITTSFPIMIYSDDQEYLENSYKKLSTDDRLDVYKKNNLPEHFFYELPEVTGDLVIVPKPNYYPFIDKPTTSKGSHGWDPMVTEEMDAIFYADGPAFKKDTTIGSFDNIHVFPLMAKILGLEYDPSSIDGKLEVLQPILAE